MSKRSVDDAEADVSANKKAQKAKRDDDAPDSNPQSDSQLKKDEEGSYYLDLGGMKRATVNSFKGKVQVNIREYYTDKNENVRPGKKGITLGREQWTTLLAGTTTLSQQLEIIEAAGPTNGDADKKKKKVNEKVAKTKKGEKAAKKKKKKQDSEAEASSEE